MSRHGIPVAVLAAGLLAAAAVGAGAGEEAGLSPDQALKRIMEGNIRAAKGASAAPQGQKPARPFAAVLDCSDSGAAPERIFDQAPGDIFVVRVAGNVADSAEQGSLEFAAEQLGVSLIVVLGHKDCPTVNAAAAGAKAESSLGALFKRIEPAVRSAKARVKDEKAGWLGAAIEDNARANARILVRKNPTIRRLAAQGKLKVVAGVYDPATGDMQLLDLEQDLKAEHQARLKALRGLGMRWKSGQLNEEEKNRLLNELLDLVQEAR